MCSVSGSGLDGLYTSVNQGINNHLYNVQILKKIDKKYIV